MPGESSGEGESCRMAPRSAQDFQYFRERVNFRFLAVPTPHGFCGLRWGEVLQ
jgi:hypothetical protein